MRTTIKRGIGRAGFNGNGHAGSPPAIGPVVRYRQPEPPRRSLVAMLLRGLGWLVLAIAVVASGVGGGLYLYAHETLRSVSAINDPSLRRAQVNLSPIADPSKPAIALIAGYDHRAGTGTTSYAGSNSDTLMLVRADPTNDTLSLLSFPRDMWVPIYCQGNTPITSNRINSAWAMCGANGPGAVLDTMEHLTGLKINYLITLDFHAFKQIVNRLHGVYMNVDRRYYNPLGTGWSAINLHPGYQKLDGGQALSYVRFRHTDSDIYRTGRQQLFLDALKARVRQTLSLFEIPQLIGALKNNLEIGRGGGGTVSLGELQSYGKLLEHLPAGHVFRDSIPLDQFHYFTTAGGADVESVAPQSIETAVHQFEHPNISEPKQVSDQLLGHKATHKKKKTNTPPLKAKDISVLVLNAGTVPGRAANTTYLLTQRGYHTAQLPSTVAANAPRETRDTIVYYDPVQPHAKQAAQQMKPLFGAATQVEQMTQSIASFAQQAGNPLVVAAVGTRFGGTLVSPPKKVKLPPPPPPALSPGGPVTLGPLRQVAREVPFRVMVPQKIAQGAQLSTEEGVRVFRPIRNHKTICLTYVMPNGIEYWNIEETNWNSAPILDNPTDVIPYHGSKLYLYTTAGAVQMVVLRTKTATYWVTNTILNELSNSTMLAIAKSLTPITK
ncbi:MAG TPA: LCP family protein [Gaiellaceae bacterium]|jgi:LCP family protein required for cell wall assembly|nr:LCP family protein [Gaiellaceae bacterium]